MAYTLTVKNDRNETLDLSGNEYIKIYKIGGLSPAAAEISAIDAVGYDGGSFSAARTGYRNITLQLVPVKNIEESRQLLYTFFAPKKKVRLYFKNKGRDVYIDGYVETMEADLFDEMQTADISILCPNPYFIKNEDPDHYAADTSDNKATLTLNGGDTESGLKFTINLNAPHGRHKPIIIENTTHNEKITIKNTAEYYGGYFIINTFPGEKSATHGTVEMIPEDNIIADIEIPMTANGYSRKWVMLHPGENVFKIYIQDRELSDGTGVFVKVTTYRYYTGV